MNEGKKFSIVEVKDKVLFIPLPIKRQLGKNFIIKKMAIIHPKH